MLSKIARRLMCLVVLFLVFVNANAQYAPNSLNYQAVARDAEGKALNNKSLKVRLSILTSDPNGDIAWREEHNVTTNSLGLFTLNIGTGHKTDGYATSLNTIEWGKYAQFLKVEIDFGSGLMHMGTTQMMAVPYALYAEKAGSSKPDFSGFLFDSNSNALKNEGTTVADLSPLKQTLVFDQSNYHLSLSGTPGIVDLRQFIHAPQDLRISNNKMWLTGNMDSSIIDLSQYKQSLSITANSKLEISGGNSVKVDTSNVNEIQTLSVSGNTVTLSKGGGEISIDASSSNELQDLTLAYNKISLTNSAARAIPIDTSNVNEIQDLVITGNKLSVSGSTVQVDFDRNESNELQNLIKADNKLLLTNSTSRAIPVDTSLTNELQVLRKVNDKLELSESGGRAIPIDTSLNNEIQSLNKIDGKLVLSGVHNGRAVPVDTSLTNEIQILSKVGNIIKLTDGGEVTADDSDADPNNELITSIDYNDNSQILSVNEGETNSSVSLKRKQIFFSYRKDSKTNVNDGDNFIFKFPTKEKDDLSVYNPSTGILKVPSDGAGLYCLLATFNYTLDNGSVIFELFVNGNAERPIYFYNQPILINLNANDEVYINVKVSNTEQINKCSFIGHRIN